MIRARTRTVARTAIGFAAGTVIRAAKKAGRCTQSVADQVAQRIVLRALVDAVTFAESFNVNYCPDHHLTWYFNVCLPRMPPEIMPYPNPPSTEKKTSQRFAAERT